MDALLDMVYKARTKLDDASTENQKLQEGSQLTHDSIPMNSNSMQSATSGAGSSNTTPNRIRGDTIIIDVTPVPVTFQAFAIQHSSHDLMNNDLSTQNKHKSKRSDDWSKGTF